MSDARVTFVDEEPNGLARMIGGLIEANLQHHPGRVKLLRPAVVDLVASDAEVEITLRFEGGSVAVENGAANPRADVRITADSLSLVELAASPLLLGLPSPFHRDGRNVLRKVLARGIRIRGLVRHPLRLTRTSRLLSVV